MASPSLASDRPLLDVLRRLDSASVSDLVTQLGVTATAVRQRLTRLMNEGLVQRKAERHGRGRPSHRYSLTVEGTRSSGDNYADLAITLWEEIRAIDDPAIRRGLLTRLVQRLASAYAQEVQGETLESRMSSVAQLMKHRDVPFEASRESGLPILTATACPYPDLAEQDRSVCAMEKMLFTELLGESVRLTACRLDGDSCCTFQPQP